MRRDGQSFVYFIRRADGVGPVKIGHSWSPDARLSTLATWSPYPLAIIATLPGGERLERRFHALFADSHSHREWFLPSPGLDALIAAVRHGEFDTGSLPAPQRLPRRPLRQRTPEQREASGIRISYSHLFVRNGLEGAPELRAAIDGLDDLVGATRVDTVRLIREHLSDPLKYGVQRPYPWAQSACAALSERRARRAA